MFAQALESVKRRYLGGSAPSGQDAAGDHPRGPGATATPGDRPHVLPPDEAILRLVEARDGRVEQGAIVDALEWSPATVSRRLGELEADGRVVRYPVGRRKIVCLPDRQPAATRSPFEA